jgi:hypothetical protein
MGKNAGGRFEFIDPGTKKRMSDRVFRRVGSYKKYAKQREIEWQNSWSTKWSINWEKIPTEIILILKEEAKLHELSCKKIRLPKKHKYIYIKGRTKKETNTLKSIFKVYNPKHKQDKNVLGLPYPKKRGV